MATYSRAELRNQVLEDLALMDESSAPHADDATLCDRRCQQELERLAEDGLIPFDLDADAIPAPYMGPLAAVIAPTLVGAYGLYQRRAELEALAAEGMRKLYKLRHADDFGSINRATYF